MIITGVRLCGRHLQLRRLLICNCEKLSISARLMQRLHHWPHQLPAGSELIRLLLLMGQRGRGERKGAALSGDVPAAPLPWTRGQRGSPRRGKHIASGDWTRACLLVPVPGEGPHRRWHLAWPAGAVSAGSGSPRAPVGTAAGLMPSCQLCTGHVRYPGTDRFCGTIPLESSPLPQCPPAPGAVVAGLILPPSSPSAELGAGEAMLCFALPCPCLGVRRASQPSSCSPSLCPLLLCPLSFCSPSLYSVSFCSCPWRSCLCSQHLDQSASFMHSN